MSKSPYHLDIKCQVRGVRGVGSVTLLVDGLTGAAEADERNHRSIGVHRQIGCRVNFEVAVQQKCEAAFRLPRGQLFWHSPGEQVVARVQIFHEMGRALWLAPPPPTSPPALVAPTTCGRGSASPLGVLRNWLRGELPQGAIELVVGNEKAHERGEGQHQLG